MAKTENPIGKGTRQIVINLHQEDAQRAPEASVINHGEIVVQGTDEDAKLYVKRKTGGVATFIESATTHNAIEAAITEVEGYINEQGFEYSANTAAMSGYIQSNYALSADTEQAIADAKAEVIGNEGDAASADTIYGAKAYADSIVAETSITGATGDDYVYAHKDGLNIVVSANTGAVATDTGKLAVTDDVKAYVDGVSGSIETQINTVSGNVESKINEVSGNIESQINTVSGDIVTYVNTVSGNIESQINTVSGNLETAINNEASARTDADQALSDRIAALEAISGETESALQEVTASGDTYVNASVAGKSAITVSTVTGSVETGEDKLAVASDVKAYVGSVSGSIETQINTVSGNIETKINTVSGDIVTYVNTASGNLETAIKEEASARTEADKELSDRIDAIESGSVVTVEKLNAPTSSAYAATYVVKQNGEQVGAAIDIPKDYLVKSATIEVCETADVPVPGLQPGDKYIDFVVNAKDGQGEESHIYLPVADLAHVYSAGNGIEISSGDVVSAKVVAANGLSVDANGIAMALATSGASGAMSAADKAKLDGIEDGAQVNKLEGVQVNGANLTIDGEKKVNVTVTSGSANGTIAVNGADVNVTGLESAAFVTVESLNNTASGYAVAAKDEVIGDTGNTSGDTTIYGVQKYVDQKVSEVVAGSVTGATGDSFVTAEVNNNHEVVIASVTGAVEDNEAKLAVANDVKAYVDAAEESAYERASAYTDAEITALSSTTHTEIEAAKAWASGYTDDEIDALSSTTHTEIEAAKAWASGYTDDEIADLKGDASDSGDTLGKLEDRIEAIEDGGVQSVTKKAEGGDGSYVTITVDNTDAQNPVISVSDDIQAVASADASNMGLAEASDVKNYVDGQIETLSGNVVTKFGDYATSAATESAIADAKDEVIGNTGNTSADTTIYGVQKYVDEKVSELTDDSIKSVDVTNKDAMAISATTVDRAVTLDFTNMIIDCGNY
jgi:DNA-binding CsgD family transcriptional regulator